MESEPEVAGGLLRQGLEYERASLVAMVRRISEHVLLEERVLDARFQVLSVKSVAELVPYPEAVDTEAAHGSAEQAHPERAWYVPGVVGDAHNDSVKARVYIRLVKTCRTPGRGFLPRVPCRSAERCLRTSQVLPNMFSGWASVVRGEGAVCAGASRNS